MSNRQINMHTTAENEGAETMRDGGEGEGKLGGGGGGGNKVMFGNELAAFCTSRL